MFRALVIRCICAGKLTNKLTLHTYDADATEQSEFELSDVGVVGENWPLI